MTSPTQNLISGRTLTRDQFLILLQASQKQDAIRFARRAALLWLAAYPGDLPVNLIYARLLTRAGQHEQALETLNRLCQIDPEYREAVETKLQVEIELGRQAATTTAKTVPVYTSETIGWLQALGNGITSLPGAVTNLKSPTVKALVSWSRPLVKARRQLARGEAVNAEQTLHGILASNLRTPLVAVTHLRTLVAQAKNGNAPMETLRTLATHYQQRWPACLVFRLVLAEALLESGSAEKAVALLHAAVSEDVTGQVAARLWGTQHAYRNLWPEELTVDMDLPVPAEVAAQLGWNQLPSSTTNAFASTPAGLKGIPQKEINPPLSSQEQAETIQAVQEELKKISVRLRRPDLSQGDGRFPVYVIMTTQTGLQSRFGAVGTAALETALLELAAAIQHQHEWGATLFFADTGRAIGPTALQLGQAAQHKNDAWSLKLALRDLDEKLQQTGERIGAVLIVGGPAVVPFHNLPNPVDDADDEVPSDNPYGTLDENYFIPEWPVGRLPEGEGDAAASLQFLLQTITNLTDRYTRQAPFKARPSWWSRLWNWLTGWLVRNGTGHSSYGYTAAVWRQASMAVFRPVGDAGTMYTSPPVGQPDSSTRLRPVEPLPDGNLAYFNLHGLEDAVEWYGQRELQPVISSATDATQEAGLSGFDYPIAVTPADILGACRIPSVIFSEACYGAHILGRRVDQALALTFLQAGAQALVGSTCTAYGSISPPLIAADMLGQSFWEYIQQGLPAGEALRHAKISLASEMHNRQGYLDGEDQKTLISFVLYGDPLAYPLQDPALHQPIRRLAKNPLELNTVCDLAHAEGSQEQVPIETLYYVKRLVQQYLPGMQDAEVIMSREHRVCKPGEPGCPVAAGSKRVFPNQAARRVVTLSKQVKCSNHDHHHYARLTLDSEGKLVKLVVSR